ncbi:hypothetical protein [Malacoplasma iowae]|uniref:Uncharacterized protein n=1 Tax=Malacoplasma iowae DK-CPA TaxID=1394179 RepID=A0A084U3X2_MALIO|nr:hypothetical protein [Malacoplasma iowae]KFB07658.1 hypothetical protein P271_509 [Malacoplasma iowae DK-CPA]WPL37417.1 hypothetical protein QX182_02815 [Malacoplasma iowae]WPL41034.1 hypothetical protein QX184_00295 [Malacoplasma iowae]
MNIKNKFKLLIASTIGIASASIPFISINSIDYNYTNKINETIDSNKNTLNDTVTTNDGTFATETGLENISTSIGPIVLNNDKKTVESRDWYGAINWSVDVSQIDTENNATVSDWEYLQKDENLYLITSNSYLIKINATTGEILAKASKSESEVSSNSDRIGGIDYNDTLYVWSSKTSNPIITIVDRNTFKKTGNQITTTSFAGEKLLKILPIEVGYNLAVTAPYSTSQNEETISSLTFTLVNDEMKPIINNKDKPITNELTNFGTTGKFTVSNINLKYESIFIEFIERSQTQSKILFVDKTAYEIKTYKNAIEKSTVTEILKSDQNKTFTNDKSLNSAFIDANGLIYFKRRNETSIWKLSTTNTLDGTFNLKNTSNSDLNKITTKDDNDLMIFGVPTEQDKKTNSANNLFLIDPKSKFATGSQSNVLKTNNFYNSQVEIKYVGNQTKLPSLYSIRDFQLSEFADSINLTNNDAKFEIDDRQGKIKLTITAYRQAWYSSLANIKTKVKVRYENTVKKLDESVIWASEPIFKGLFGNYTPNQINESTLESKGSDIIVSSSITTANGYSNIQRKFLITSTDNTNGKINLQGTFTYTDKYNTTIVYTLPDKQYTIKPTSTNSYEFKMYGQSKTNSPNGDEQAIDISTITSSQNLNTLKNFVPSLVTSDQEFLAKAFIEIQNSYPIDDGIRSVYITERNDEDGTLTVNVDYNGLANTIQSSFKQKYTGFKTNTQARVDFAGTKTPYDNLETEGIKEAYSKNHSDYSFIDITQNGLYPNYGKEIANPLGQFSNTYSSGIQALATMGYTPKVEVTTGESGVEYGYVEITLDYSAPSDENRKKLPNSLLNSFGLKDGKIKSVYFGFLPIRDIYWITLKNYSSKDVQNIVTTYKVDDVIDNQMLINSLELNGYTPNEIQIRDKTWDGEKLNFVVFAQSNEYKSVNGQYSFTIDWAPQFAAIRERNIILAASLTLVGIGIVSFGIGAYILRKNKMRRMLK